MKFIQDIDGNFVRVDKIIALKVSKLQKWNVLAYCENEHCYWLKTYNTEAEARSWLKEFVDALGEEGYRHADSD